MTSKVAREEALADLERARARRRAARAPTTLWS